MVAGPPKKGRKGAAAPGTDRVDAARPDEIEVPRRAGSAGIPVGLASPPPPEAPPPAARRQGLPVRRLLIDAAVGLGAIGAVIIVGSLLASPTSDPGGTPGSATNAPAASSAAATAGAGGAEAGGSAAPSAATSAQPSAGGLGGRCPDTPECFVYTVQPGDTLVSIGSLLGVTRTGILALNETLTEDATLESGANLRVPTPTR